MLHVLGFSGLFDLTPTSSTLKLASDTQSLHDQISSFNSGHFGHCLVSLLHCESPRFMYVNEQRHSAVYVVVWEIVASSSCQDTLPSLA